ncbi:hypothetical protein FQN60_014459, partial [Etheostoma spectabile]
MPREPANVADVRLYLTQKSSRAVTKSRRNPDSKE